MFWLLIVLNSGNERVLELVEFVFNLLLKLLPSLWRTANIDNNVVKLAYWSFSPPSLSFLNLLVVFVSCSNFFLEGIRVLAE